MPLTRYQIRNEYGLADMELYGAADKDDPEALLEGVAMAGLVGVLRQLGDLADFAAEIFHCLHEELMVTAARGQGLVVRVQQLEAGVPLIEKAALSQAYLSSFFSHPGSDWHPILQTENNLITHGELPRCMADSYEECRDPPRLFLLDKFDVAGAGACLKRYSDPSLFKTQAAPSGIATSEVGKTKKAQRPMKKGSHWTNGETPQLVPTSHAKLHQLFSMEHVDCGYRDPVFHVKLKRRQLNEAPVNPSSGRSYMEKFLQSPSTECEKLPGFYSKPRVSTLGNEDSFESEAKVTEISAAKETQAKVCNVQEVFSTPMPYLDSRDTVKDIKIEPEPDADVEAVKMPSTPQKRMTKEKPLANLEGGPTSCLNVTFSGDLTTRVGDCTDALTSMESKTTETDNEYSLRNYLGFLEVKPQIYSDADGNQEEVPSQFPDTHAIGHASMLDAVHHSFEEAGSDVLYADFPSPSPKARPPNVEGSAETVDISFSQPSVNEDSLGTGTSELVSLSGLGAAEDSICKLKETPFCLSSCENPPHLLQDPATSMQFGSEKLHANEIRMTFSGTSGISDVHSDSGDTVDASFEALPVHLPKLPCVVPEAEGSTDEVLQTNYADHCETENISNMGTESTISFSVLMEEPFSGLTSQETEVRTGTSLFLGGTESVKSEDISSEADAPISAAEIKSESVMRVEVESEKILLARDAGTISFEDLSPVATLAGNSFPEEDVVNLENVSSMDAKTDNLISPFNISSGNGTVTAYTSQNPLTGSELLSASSHNDPLVDRDLDVMAHHHEQEDLQPVSIVSDDNKHGELLARDNDVKDGIGTLKYHASISEDVYQNNQTGQDNIDSETMYEEESRKSDVDMFCIHPDSVWSPRESLTGIQKSLLQHPKEAEQTDALSSECCSRSQDQEQQHPSETAAAILNSYDISVQELFFDLEDSSPEEPESGISRQGHLESETESLLQNNHLQGIKNTLPLVASYPQGYESKQLPELKDLHMEHLPAHKESSISLTLNDCSEPMLSADHTDKMPPPPPLPPLQWCTGKPQATARSDSNESIGKSTVDLTATREDSWVRLGENALEASSTTGLPLPAVKVVAVREDSWVPLGENALEASSATGLPLPAVKHVAVDQSAPGTGFEGEAIEHVQQNPGKIYDPPPKDVLTSSAAGKTLPVNVFGPSRTLGDENSHENPMTRKLVPLGDAVPAIDRSMLRKISERVRPPGEPKVDEKDSLLEVIRNKSFSLKPAVTSARPNIQMAPQTNVKVAAILEKANTLRQAMAGSDDDDDDSDSWSDT